MKQDLRTLVRSIAYVVHVIVIFAFIFLMLVGA